MTIDEMLACAFDSDRAFIQKACAEISNVLDADDGPAGVQARMMCLLETWQLCIIHERRRALARGISSDVLYKGIVGSFVLLAINFAEIIDAGDEDKKSVIINAFSEIVNRACAAIDGKGIHSITRSSHTAASGVA